MLINITEVKDIDLLSSLRGFRFLGNWWMLVLLIVLTEQDNLSENQELENLITFALEQIPFRYDRRAIYLKGHRSL